MQKPNQRLDSFISEFTSGEILPLPPDESDDEQTKRIWSGSIAEIEEQTYRTFMNDVAGPPKLKQDDWYIFSDARSSSEPGILFWQRFDKFFARRLDQDEWDKLIRVAKVKKTYW